MKTTALLVSVFALAGVLSGGCYATSANAASIILDGTFLNSIGAGNYLTPWSDWTDAGITRHLAPDDIPGNYASMPMYSDLFQRFSQLQNGTYLLTFDVENQSQWSANLVFAAQTAFGTTVNVTSKYGTSKELLLPSGGSVAE